MITPADLEKLLRRFQSQSSGSEVAELLSGATSEVDDRRVEELCDAVVRDGIRRGATDIHIQPEEHLTRVRYRIDGVLRTAESLPRDVSDAVISRVKISSRLDIAERRLPQDGRIELDVNGEPIDLRVAYLRPAFGPYVAPSAPARPALRPSPCSRPPTSPPRAPRTPTAAPAPPPTSPPLAPAPPAPRQHAPSPRCAHLIPQPPSAPLRAAPPAKHPPLTRTAPPAHSPARTTPPSTPSDPPSLPTSLPPPTPPPRLTISISRADIKEITEGQPCGTYPQNVPPISGFFPTPPSIVIR